MCKKNPVIIHSEVSSLRFCFNLATPLGVVCTQRCLRQDFVLIWLRTCGLSAPGGVLSHTVNRFCLVRRWLSSWSNVVFGSFSVVARPLGVFRCFITKRRLIQNLTPLWGKECGLEFCFKYYMGHRGPLWSKFFLQQKTFVDCLHSSCVPARYLFG